LIRNNTASQQHCDFIYTSLLIRFNNIRSFILADWQSQSFHSCYAATNEHPA